MWESQKCERKNTTSTKTNKDKKQEYNTKPWMLCCSTFQTWIQSRKMSQHEWSKTHLHNLNNPDSPKLKYKQRHMRKQKKKQEDKKTYCKWHQQVVACLETKKQFWTPNTTITPAIYLDLLSRQNMTKPFRGNEHLRPLTPPENSKKKTKTTQRQGTNIIEHKYMKHHKTL